MLKDKYPYYLANEPRYANADLEVRNKFSGEVATRVALADVEAIDEAIGSAVEAALPMRNLPAFRRADILHHAARRFEERSEELARALCIEAGKPIKDSRGEVTRLIDTFRIAAEEAVRFGGEYMPLDISSRAAGYQSITKRVPIGPCSFISPFNFPLNLAAHKVAPAIAVGCPFVLKPASLTPIGALLIGEILAETDLPKGAFSVLPVRRDGAELFTTDDRLKLLSFTGSPDVGWNLKAKAGKKKVVLELGGNAGCIVDRDTDLEYAAARITFGAFYQSGQSCISVQRVFIHDSIYDQMLKLLVARAKMLKAGDPLNEDTSLGPIISEREAIRVEEWIKEAEQNGAKTLCGGKRDGIFVDATWLEDVSPKDRASSREFFGPVALVERFTDFKEAVSRVNQSDYGLQAGVFTKNIDHAFYAWNELDVGGVIVGDIPSMRIDSMPYGGVKDSGLGREGIRFAMEDMSEIRLLVLSKAGNI
ncbi:MAG: aldehyde dehydrogenase family protein [Proteobacteria bacterium]|nr:aldehyde dehydrogenase family protein [Pseudomonadota bacterium]